MILSVPSTYFGSRVVPRVHLPLLKQSLLSVPDTIQDKNFTFGRKIIYTCENDIMCINLEISIHTPSRQLTHTHTYRHELHPVQHLSSPGKMLSRISEISETGDLSNMLVMMKVNHERLWRVGGLDNHCK